MNDMRETILRNLETRFAAYAELVAALDESALGERLDAPRHKSLAEHLWCIVGARESYAKAIAAGEWRGFGCSMSGQQRADFEKSLDSSARATLDAVANAGEWTETRDDLLASLAEHEVMHEGQIIRHMYGLGRDLPSSWKWA